MPSIFGMRMSTSATSNPATGDRGQGTQAVLGFGDDFVRQFRRDIGQQVTQTRACRRLVVDDHHRLSGETELPVIMANGRGKAGRCVPDTRAGRRPAALARLEASFEIVVQRQPLADVVERHVVAPLMIGAPAQGLPDRRAVRRRDAAQANADRAASPNGSMP
jgi:hypothetical protein